MLEFWAVPTSAYRKEEFSPERRTVLYCASGGRSALAADTLQRMGYANVAHLDGGIKAWKGGGLPVERVGPASSKASRRSRLYFTALPRVGSPPPR